ncbi:astakine-like [Argiope bruennichi]|uniref:Astakine like protein n=1 Tax=Argiope bruennichi TaxID=94029 RepID=A0A8T0FJW7_ARGBR|nr:astakine-like [Argiope bruennichi]KAF8789670.1 Astakine like protein [Argiope bruennichi]
MNHLLVFSCLFFASTVLASRSWECSKPGECGPNECCVVGVIPYSYPRCEPFGQEGSTCIVGNEPEIRVLFYKSKPKLVHGVYRKYCPCGGSLTCSKEICQ